MSSDQKVFTDSDGRQYVLRKVKRHYVDAQGNPKEYFSNIKVYRSSGKRGRKQMPNKRLLKNELPYLSDSDCIKLIKIIEAMKNKKPMYTINEEPLSEFSETENDFSETCSEISSTESEYSDTSSEYSETEIEQKKKAVLRLLGYLKKSKASSDYSETESDISETCSEISSTETEYSETCSETDND